MEWSNNAEKKYNELLFQVPINYREQIRDGIRREAERYAAEKVIDLIGENEVIAGYIMATPVYQREDIKERLARCGIDWHKYSDLFRQ